MIAKISETITITIPHADSPKPLLAGPWSEPDAAFTGVFGWAFSLFALLRYLEPYPLPKPSQECMAEFMTETDDQIIKYTNF